MNVAALIAYDGARYHGFQRQSRERGPTVQGEIEAALERVVGTPTPLVGSGRTDAGVHAEGQVINFHTEARLSIDAWLRALNARLPADIAVRATCEVPESFHARTSALWRSYRYTVFCDPVRSPLRERYAWRAPRRLDVDAMNCAALWLVGERDFGAFGSSPWDRREDKFRGPTVRRMISAGCFWVAPSRMLLDDEDAPAAPDGVAPSKAERLGQFDEIAFEFTANAFLKGMVRRLVGTLRRLGEGLLTDEELRAIVDAVDKGRAGPTAPACGLRLMEVTYPPGLVNWQRG